MNRDNGKYKTPLQFINALTSGIDIGAKKDGHPIHLNTNTEIIRHYRKLEAGGRSWLKHRWNKAMLTEHCEGEETYYYAGSQESKKKPEMLAMIDIDCHKSGTLKGALAFAHFLRGTLFPNLYFEISTNGNGVHCYLILEKDGLGAGTIKTILMRQLQPHLNELANGFDIELVEIKGLPPEIEWGSREI